MKATLLLAAAFAFVTSAALAQTVTPGTTPGAQTGNPSNMPSAGTTTTTDPAMNNTSMDKMSASDKRAMRKSKKTKSSDGMMKTKTKM
ncbi:hypothetical protein E4631_05785 [Hymenobacter sp. UV11]|uniref:hypothetical protein n=1 Tax=Hymenobacter sp. UV11 TaxID=1849735 RepID=UPI00105DB60D|nr:hypothetical protein [Hymenobacter sp. UV11]TDN39938.1 hypothetical protein A8B98_16315 [Hymenobacter sp. UV11]TFZ67491.1 hypothetical protein E4631_05785 [Hymenobacter sp. UV11]